MLYFPMQWKYYLGRKWYYQKLYCLDCPRVYWIPKQ